MKKVIILIIACLIGILLHAQEQNLHWTPEIGDFQFYMALTSVVQIDGVEQTTDQLEVGAFCGNQCRGAQMVELFELPEAGNFQRYVVYLSIFGTDGESMSFKLFDHRTNQELDLTSPAPVSWTQDPTEYDEFDPYILNFTSPEPVFELPITGYGTGTGNYYLIATPVAVDPEDVEGMTDGNFDLYYFDESKVLEWINYEMEGGQINHFDLVPGKGYLYAHDEDITLRFTGTPYNGEPITLQKTEGAEFSGWNLVGNPYTVTAYIDRDFYVMREDGEEIIAGKGNAIAPMQGIFVIAGRDGEEMTFSTNAPANNGGSKVVVNVRRNRSDVIDRAMVRFGGGALLPKLMLHPESTKLYIAEGEKEYAVARNNGNNVTPVCFRAAEDGTYKLNVEVDNMELEYLHLIDNMTGADVDLLQTPEYTFQARTTDYSSRFQLVFANTSELDEKMVETFAHFNGEGWIVNSKEESILQVVDMNGRIVNSQAVSGKATVQIDAVPGVYMLRLVNGENVKTQKVVVR